MRANLGVVNITFSANAITPELFAASGVKHFRLTTACKMRKDLEMNSELEFDCAETRADAHDVAVAGDTPARSHR
jgi:hypothetical protein